MPEVKKAELIQGIVYMPSPVRIDYHGEPDSLTQGWLFTYAVATPGVKSATNTTVRLGRDDVLQPDGILRLLPESGGQAQADKKGLLAGPPELVFEVAASSASIDVNAKKTSCRRGGVQEYVVWRTLDEALDWWTLDDDDYSPLSPDEDGIHRSRVFPGLWLDVAALLRGEGKRVIEILSQGLASEDHAKIAAKFPGSMPPGVPPKDAEFVAPSANGASQNSPARSIG